MLSHKIAHSGPYTRQNSRYSRYKTMDSRYELRKVSRTRLHHHRPRSRPNPDSLRISWCGFQLGMKWYLGCCAKSIICVLSWFACMNSVRSTYTLRVQTATTVPRHHARSSRLAPTSTLIVLVHASVYDRIVLVFARLCPVAPLSCI
jgi:hypothetical protein